MTYDTIREAKEDGRMPLAPGEYLKWTRTREPQNLPASYAARDWLPTRTPIVGDRVCYLSGLGDILTAERALELLREGRTVKFETWSVELRGTK